MSMVRNVVGGVDTQADVHVAAAVDGNGGVLGIEAFAANEAGYQELLSWLGGFGSVSVVGVEGSGSYGVGLARFLHHQDVAPKLHPLRDCRRLLDVQVPVGRPGSSLMRRWAASTLWWRR